MGDIADDLIGRYDELTYDEKYFKNYKRKRCNYPSNKKKNKYIVIINGKRYRKFIGKYCENIFWQKEDKIEINESYKDIDENYYGEHVRGNEICYRPEKNTW